MNRPTLFVGPLAENLESSGLGAIRLVEEHLHLPTRDFRLATRVVGGKYQRVM